MIITIAGWPIHRYLSPTNQAMIYLLAVVAVAWRRGLWLAIFTSIIGVLAFDFFFVPPYLTFRFTDSEYLITFAGMVIVGSLMASSWHGQKTMPMQRASGRKRPGRSMPSRRTLAVAVTTDAIITAVRNHIRGIFEWDSVFLLPKQNGLVVHSASPGLVTDDDDIAVATWAFQHGAVAGYDTDTLHGSRLRFIPLQGTQGIVGIMGSGLRNQTA